MPDIPPGGPVLPSVLPYQQNSMKASFWLSTRPRKVKQPLLRLLHLQSHDGHALLASRGLPVIPSKRANTVREVGELTKQALEIGHKGVTVNGEVLVPEGERSAARWPSGRLGLSHVADSVDKAVLYASELLGQTVSTPSTQDHPKPCKAVTITPLPSEGSSVALLLLASRKSHRPVFVASVAATKTELPLDITQETIDTESLFAFFDQLQIVDADNRHSLRVTLQGLWEAWRDLDLLRLGVTVHLSVDKAVQLTGVSILVDPFALHRQPGLAALADPTQRSTLDHQASRGKLFYHKQSVGNIGQYGYGAGVAMATMDALMLAGGKPANFLDGGGGATPENVQAAINLLFADPDVKVFFINSFGGITKTELIAQGLVRALRQRKESGHRVPPVIARLRGTGSAEAEQVIKDATDLPELAFVADMGEAAQAAVRAAASCELSCH